MSILGALTGSDAADAARKAAADTYAKQKAATGSLTTYGDTLPGQYADIAKVYDPYVSGGNDALARLMTGLGLGGDGAGFTAAVHALPGYQAGLDTGTTAAMRGLNAGPGLQSGAALKALYRYGSDYEDQRTGDYLNRLMGLTGVGASATGAKAGTLATGVGANTDIRKTAYGGDMTSAGTIGQGDVAAAQAEQDAIGNLLKSATYLGGAALGGGLGGGLGSLMSQGGGYLAYGTNPFTPSGARNPYYG